jgi:PAS domain-containing protein
VQFHAHRRGRGEETHDARQASRSRRGRRRVPQRVRARGRIHKDGSSVWVAVVTSVIRGEDGRPRYFLSVVQDVSSRRAAELALRESEEKFRQLADNIPEISGSPTCASA